MREGIHCILASYVSADDTHGIANESRARRRSVSALLMRRRLSKKERAKRRESTQRQASPPFPADDCGEVASQSVVQRTHLSDASVAAHPVRSRLQRRNGVSETQAGLQLGAALTLPGGGHHERVRQRHEEHDEDEGEGPSDVQRTM